MILLIDWGNTDLKSLQVSALLATKTPAASIQRFADPQAFVAQLQGRFERILIASVRNDADNQLLMNLLADKSERIEFAQTSSAACGVSCAYANPEQLGVDRWLGVIAAAQQSGNIAVISIGSAITLDVVESGKHLGGQIIPGRRLLLTSLKQTGRVTAADSAEISAQFALGQSTTDCVHFGVNTLIAGYLSQAIEATERAFQVEQIIVTGGGGEFWASRLETAGRVIEYRPALVFEGLVALFSASK